jgi:hypothetical protein
VVTLAKRPPVFAIFLREVTSMSNSARFRGTIEMEFHLEGSRAPIDLDLVFQTLQEVIAQSMAREALETGLDGSTLGARSVIDRFELGSLVKIES